MSFSAVAGVQGELHAAFAGATLTRGAPGSPDSLALACDPDLLQLYWDYSCSLAGQVVASGDPANVQTFTLDGAFEHLVQVQAGNGLAGALEAEGLSLHFDAPIAALIDGSPHQLDTVTLSLAASEAWRVSDVLALNVQGDALGAMTATAWSDESTPAVDVGKEKHWRGHVTVLKSSLTLGGSMQTGKTSAVMLHDYPANEPGGVFLGLAAQPTPFKGGFLVPVPLLSLLFINTDASGGVDLPFVWPSGIPVGFEFYAQAAVRETPPQEIWITNALRITSQ